MVEVQTGVFVGRLSAVVRDLLWEKCKERLRGGRCCQAYRMNNEQGYAVRIAGDERRVLVDLDGIVLPAVQSEPWKAFNEGNHSILDK